MIFINPVDRYGHAIYASFDPKLAAQGWIGIRMHNVQIVNPRKGWWLIYEHEHVEDEQDTERHVHPLLVVWGSERNARMRAARTYRPNVYSMIVKPIRFVSEPPMKYKQCPKCRGSGQCWEYDPRCFYCFGLGAIEWDGAKAEEDSDEFYSRGKLTSGKILNCDAKSADQVYGDEYYSDDERYERSIADAKDQRFRFKYHNDEYVDMDCMFLRVPPADPWVSSGWEPLPNKT